MAHHVFYNAKDGPDQDESAGHVKHPHGAPPAGERYAEPGAGPDEAHDDVASAHSQADLEMAAAGVDGM